MISIIMIAFVVCFGVIFILELDTIYKTLKIVLESIYYSSIYGLVYLASKKVKGMMFYIVLFVLFLIALIIMNNWRDD